MHRATKMHIANTRGDTQGCTATQIHTAALQYKTYERNLAVTGAHGDRQQLIYKCDNIFEQFNSDTLQLRYTQRKKVLKVSFLIHGDINILNYMQQIIF